MSKYTVFNGTEHVPFTKKADAVKFAAERAKHPESDHRVEIWSRPFWSVGFVQHYPDTGKTYLAGYDRYGYERGGEEITT